MVKEANGKVFQSSQLLHPAFALPDAFHISGHMVLIDLKDAFPTFSVGRILTGVAFFLLVQSGFHDTQYILALLMTLQQQGF